MPRNSMDIFNEIAHSTGQQYFYIKDWPLILLPNVSTTTEPMGIFLAAQKICVKQEIIRWQTFGIKIPHIPDKVYVEVEAVSPWVW